jgi:hypothetical protein
MPDAIGGEPNRILLSDSHVVMGDADRAAPTVKLTAL